MKAHLTVFCLLVVLISVCQSATNKNQKKHRGAICGNARCVSGQECLKYDNGTRECVCRLTCPLRHHDVCGSDGRTYYNPCELHRIGCVEHRKIRLQHRRACLHDLIKNGDVVSKVTNPEDEAPLVCYQIQRDELRQLFVDWLKRQATTKGKSYQDTALDVFHSCDKNRNNRLDSDEFLTCTEKDSSANSNNAAAHILRGLCIDALVNLGDHDNGWSLQFTEFLHLLHPQFKPPTKKCQLEDKSYPDGAYTSLECNTCVCACGDWVCTGIPCRNQPAEGAAPGPVKQGRLPSVHQREAFLNGFTASDVVLVRAVQDELQHAVKRQQLVEELSNVSKH